MLNWFLSKQTMLTVTYQLFSFQEKCQPVQFTLTVLVPPSFTYFAATWRPFFARNFWRWWEDRASPFRAETGHSCHSSEVDDFLRKFPWWFPIGTSRSFWLLSCCETGPSKAATKGAWLKKAGRLAVVWVQSSIQTGSDCPILLKVKVVADITAVCWLNAWWFCLLVLVTCC